MWVYLLSVLCVLLIIFFRRNSNYWKERGIIQVDGVVWKFFFTGTSIPEIYKDIYDKYQDQLHVGLFLGAKPALLLRNLENIQTVLAGEFQSFHSRGLASSPNDKLADNILFIDDYQRWKIIRQKISPVFTGAKLKNMFYIIDRCARDFVEMVDSDPGFVKKPFNALYTYTTASIAASVFGIDTRTNTMNSPFLEMSWKVTEPNISSNVRFVLLTTFPIIAKMLDIQIFGAHEKFFVGAVKKVLESRRRSEENRHDFIDICLELQKQGVMKDAMTGYELEPSDEILAAQAFFFFLAGADTSANTMQYTLIELANNPSVLKKLHEEIDQVFDNCKEELTYYDIEKLQYLEMVINEAMRKYPPIGSFQRICTKDTTLPVGNVKIKKNSLVVIPVYGVQRDEKYFPNPDVFDPERFSPENVSNIPKFAFLPFGEGNRICIGMRLARVQVKAGLAWLLRNHTLTPKAITTVKFATSTFGLRAPDVLYDIVPRVRTEN